MARIKVRAMTYVGGCIGMFFVDRWKKMLPSAIGGIVDN
jgi:hypothetical protein